MASAAPIVPFTISVNDPTPQLRELHLTFTSEFQNMTVDQRLECMRAYVESMVKQAETSTDTGSQRGIMMIIELTEQLLPHIQTDSMPLQETLIVEMGEGAEGSSLNELLG